MRPRVGMYHLLILYEVFRLFLLLKDGSGAELLPVSWYAAAPLLAIVPTLLYLIAAKPEYGALAFPLIAIVKALSIPSLAMFIGLNAKTALQFVAMNDISLARAILSAIFVIVADTFVGLYCFRKGRSLCA